MFVKDYITKKGVPFVIRALARISGTMHSRLPP